MGNIIKACALLGGFVLFYVFCMLAAIISTCWLISIYAPAFFASMGALSVVGIYFLANLLFWPIVLPHLPQ